MDFSSTKKEENAFESKTNVVSQFKFYLKQKSMAKIVCVTLILQITSYSDHRLFHHNKVKILCLTEFSLIHGKLLHEKKYTLLKSSFHFYFF